MSLQPDNTELSPAAQGRDESSRSCHNTHGRDNQFLPFLEIWQRIWTPCPPRFPFFFRGEGKRVLKCEKLFPVELGESNSTFCPPCGTSSREISPAALCSNNASLFPSVFVKDKGNNLSSSSSSSSLRVSHTSFSLAESPWLQHQRVVVMQLIVTSALFMSCTCPVPAYSESNTIKMQAFVVGPGVTNINNAAAK